MEAETGIRAVYIEQLSRLLGMAQDVAHKLADASHGRAYDQARELSEILHLARLQIGAIQTDTSPGALLGVERRSSPRSRFGNLR